MMNHIINRRSHINNIFKKISKINEEEYSGYGGVSLTSVALYNKLNPYATKDIQKKEIPKIKSYVKESGLNLVPILNKSSILWDGSSELFYFLEKCGYNEEQHFDSSSMPYHGWDKIDEEYIREVANIGQQVNYFIESGKLLRFNRSYPDIYKKTIETAAKMHPKFKDDLRRLFLMIERATENYFNFLSVEMKKITKLLDMSLNEMNGVFDSENNDITNILKKYI